MRALKYIDKFSEWIAAPVIWFALGLAIVIVIDVVMRYLFNAPTVWAYEISWMLFSGEWLLGFAYAYREGAHVRVDFLFNLLPPRVKAIFDAFFFLLLLLPLCFAAVRYGIDWVAYSWAIGEKSALTMWAPPVYPIKTLMVVGFFFLGLQGLAIFIRNLIIAIKGRET